MWGVTQQRSCCTWLGWSKNPGKVVNVQRHVWLGLRIPEGGPSFTVALQQALPAEEPHPVLRRECGPEAPPRPPVTHSP